MVGGFDGGDITSNAGALLLGQVDRGLGLVRRFARCFTNERRGRYVEHWIVTLVGQRIFGLVLGLRRPQRSRRAAQGPNVRCAGPVNCNRWVPGRDGGECGLVTAPTSVYAQYQRAIQSAASSSVAGGVGY